MSLLYCKLLLGFFQDSLFQLLLALDAVTRPGHRFESLRVDLPAAGNAFSETTLSDTVQRTLDHRQKLAVVVALVKQKFLIV